MTANYQNGLIAASGSRYEFGVGAATARALRIENIRLNERLTAAEDVIARHATLIREADHRIKNNLQIVSSLLSVQARREKTAPARDALIVAAARLVSIARIHDEIQLNGVAELVDLGGLVKSLCHELHNMAGGGARDVAIMVSAEPFQAPTDFAQAVVLAVNELVINALRHAFAESAGGVIRVAAVRDGGDLVLIVADNGRGLPPDDGEAAGYGMKLVRMLTDQIGGVLTAESDAGATFTLRAPVL